MPTALPYFVASGHSSPGTSAGRATALVTLPFVNSGKYPDFPRDCSWTGVCTIFFEGTNTLTMDYINANNFNRVGIVMADFPGRGLISAVIRINPLKDRGISASLKSAHGKYFVAEGNGGSTVNANRTGRGSWEKFRLYNVNNKYTQCIRHNDKVALTRFRSF